MKIILAVFSLVVLVGCQDLGDYPDYKATTTTPPANGTGGNTGTDGLPVYTGKTLWAFEFGGRGVQGFVIPTENNTTNVETEGRLPDGIYVSWSRVHGNPDRQYSACWMGRATVSGVFEFFLLISNAKGTTRVKFVVMVVEEYRQSVEQ